MGQTGAIGPANSVEAYASSVKSGANWFFWIAGLSAANSIVSAFQGEWGFVVGLGATQFIDGIAAAIIAETEGGGGTTVTAVALVIDLLIASVFVLFGILANKRMAWAFVIGMVIYLFDGLLFLLVGDWLSLAFHAFALFCIFSGYAALKKLNEAEALARAEAV
ncbi:MAG: hypothetical protein AMXMBFR82_30760 [Candidatus Hydrogenedentota bacterium]